MRLFPIFVLAALLSLSACESNPPAPIEDRTARPPVANKPKAPVAESKPSIKDWRPDAYTVKKGDTLYSIGLEHGYDYKDVAMANDISAPYTIKIGQVLNLKKVSEKEAGGVTLTPLKTEAAPKVVVINTPVAESKPKEVKPAEVKSAEVKSAEAKPKETKPAEPKPTENKPVEAVQPEADDVHWQWPTQGKVSDSFNIASNKGIDINGNMGQAVKAAAAGKVIYSGADLRGYGKLVIIKHNKTYLSVYAHNSNIVVKEGQIIGAGQKIAEMGNTDSATVKLHFEIRKLGKSVDPENYLPSA